MQPQYGHRPIKCYWESSPNAKLAARIILSAPRTSQRTVTLFNNKIYLWWLPFYNRCALAFRRINGTLPHYLNTSLRKNSDNNARITRNCNLNLLSPLHKNTAVFRVVTQRSNGSLRTADKRRPEMRLRFAGYKNGCVADYSEGGRIFAVWTAKDWNNLPRTLRTKKTLKSFKSEL